MIKLDSLSPYPDADPWFDSFVSEYGQEVRQLAGTPAVEQDVLILAWMWRMGGWSGDVESWIGHLIDRVTSEYDVQRVRDQKRRALDRTVLLDRLVEHVQRQGSGSVEYLITHAPEEYRQVLTWKYVAGYTDGEIGTLLGVDQSTTTRWFRKCYRIVKETYTPNR